MEARVRLLCVALFISGVVNALGKAPATDRELEITRGLGQCGHSDCANNVSDCSPTTTCPGDCSWSGLAVSPAGKNAALGGDAGSGNQQTQGVPYCVTTQPAYCVLVPISNCSGNCPQFQCTLWVYGTATTDGEHQECCTCS
jgi:hypothetical protein